MSVSRGDIARMILIVLLGLPVSCSQHSARGYVSMDASLTDSPAHDAAPAELARGHRVAAGRGAVILIRKTERNLNQLDSAMTTMFSVELDRCAEGETLDVSRPGTRMYYSRIFPAFGTRGLVVVGTAGRGWIRIRDCSAPRWKIECDVMVQAASVRSNDAIELQEVLKGTYTADRISVERANQIVSNP